MPPKVFSINSFCVLDAIGAHCDESGVIDTKCVMCAIVIVAIVVACVDTVGTNCPNCVENAIVEIDCGEICVVDACRRRFRRRRAGA